MSMTDRSNTVQHFCLSCTCNGILS